MHSFYSPIETRIIQFAGMYCFCSNCKNSQSIYRCGTYCPAEALTVAMKHTDSGLELICLGVSNRKGKENSFSSGTLLTEFTTVCMTIV